MEIKYSKYTNKAYNRLEFLLINWDYIDGNDYLAKLFSEEYGFVVEEKIDGWWYSIIRIHLSNCEYELLWHEDTGNASVMGMVIGLNKIPMQACSFHIMIQRQLSGL